MVEVPQEEAIILFIIATRKSIYKALKEDLEIGVLCKTANAPELPEQGLRGYWKQLPGLLKLVDQKALHGTCSSLSCSSESTLPWLRLTKEAAD